MLKRCSCVTLVAVLVVGWAAYTQASAISYDETFNYGYTADQTLATATAVYSPIYFTGSASPNPVWNSYCFTKGDDIVANAGGGITLNTQNNTEYAYLPSQTGLAYASMSQPVTVSATLTTTEAAGSFGLFVGDLQIAAIVGSHREYVMNPDSGKFAYDTTVNATTTPVPVAGTPLVFSATLSQVDANDYSLDYSIGSYSATGISLKADQLGTLSGSYDGLGFYVYDGTAVL